MALRAISVCAGIGGLDLAVRLAAPGARTVVYVERELWAVAHLAREMEAARLDQAPVWSDARTFDGRPWRGAVDLVMGGIPCQPHSLAGLRAGHRDDRDLWRDFCRILDETGAPACFLENVPGLLTSADDAGRRGGAFHAILDDLAALGFDAEWDVVGARDVGAPHRRRDPHPDRPDPA